MSEWTIHAIKDIALGIYDGPHATPPLADDGPVFLGIGNVTDDGHLDLSSVRHIAEKDFGKWTRRVTPRAGDIVFTYEATLNRYAIIPEGFHGCLGRRMALIRPDADKVDTRFLFYSFFGNEWRETIEANRLSGATVDRIPLIRFPNFPIALPPLETQRRIASILGAFDDLMEVNRRRIAVLEEMARGLFEEWFVRFRFPGHEAVPILDTPDGPLPEGWSWETLGAVCKIIKSGSTPSRKEPSYWHDGTLDWFTTGELNDSFLFSSKERVSELAVKSGKARVFPTGTIFIALYGATIGALGIAAVDCSSNQAALGLVPDGVRMRRWQLYHSLSHLKAWFISVGQGAAQQNISKEKVAAARVALPPIQISELFDRVATPLWELRRVVEMQNSRLATSRDFLLPRLISGQLSVAEAERQLEEAA